MNIIESLVRQRNSISLSLLIGVCAGAAQPSWSDMPFVLEIVDAAGDVGSYNSIALDTQGHPHLAYIDATDEMLRYARWSGEGA